MSERIKYQPHERVLALLEGITSIRDRAIFTLAYWRGLRASEVGALEMRHWRADAGRLFVIRAKGGRSGEYVLSKPEVRALQSWLKVRGTSPGPLFVSRKQSPISRQQLHRLMVQYASRVPGWPDEMMHFHVLRHSIATHLLGSGLEMAVVREWLGHRSIRSTEVYAQVADRTMREAERRIYEQDEKPPARDHVPVRWKKDRRK